MQALHAMSRTLAGVSRLNFDLFGWPSSLLFLWFAWPTRGGRGGVLWWMCGSYLLLMMFQHNWGIDTFGPTHAFELSLPIIGLTVIGTMNLSRRRETVPNVDSYCPSPARWTTLSPACLAALMATAWLAFVPVRLKAVGQIATHVNAALHAPSAAGVRRGLIFTRRPFAPLCHDLPSHFVLFRPTNDPDLRNDVLWVNHLSPEQDQHLTKLFGDRSGYLLRWTAECQAVLVPIESFSPRDIF